MSVAEIWMPIPGRPGYEASSHGRVRSLDRTVVSIRRGVPVSLRWKGRILKNNPQRGYYSVCVDGAKRSHGVHVLVALAFIGPAPDGTEVDHVNGNKRDNRPNNLEYVTPKVNCQRAIASGLINRCSTANGNCKLNREEVIEIRRQYGLVKPSQIARQFGISAGHVTRIAKRIRHAKVV